MSDFETTTLTLKKVRLVSNVIFLEIISALVINLKKVTVVWH